ncbi:MAG: zinc-binding dehydrogenase [Microscillaceae bacterium]|nr:zinc-binding dehydrogenase [Microscillaceae bacterium]MDW8461490.1 zinc-binding dehydrogenase [Cytophagales bacterium]
MKPEKMLCVLLQDQQPDRISIAEVPIRSLKQGEVLVKMKAASLNHRDQWCRLAMYPNMKYPSILGSDGCGEVIEVFDDKDKSWIGKEVIFNPNVNWGDNPNYQSLNYTILGMPTDGTLAEYLIIPAHRLHEKPAHLTAFEAAALPLAALTAWRAVFTKGEISKGKNVLITGIGGGVAQFALLFSVAVGANVFVTSGSEDKIQRAVELGAKMGVNYKEKGWEKILQKQVFMGFDAIIDGTGGENFGTLAKMLGFGANLVVYGGTAGTPSPIHLPRLFFSQSNIKGTTMGTDEEFEQMLDFVNKHSIVPIIDSVRPLREAISAFDRMHRAEQFGKLVISMINK